MLSLLAGHTDAGQRQAVSSSGFRFCSRAALCDKWLVAMQTKHELARTTYQPHLDARWLVFVLSHFRSFGLCKWPKIATPTVPGVCRDRSRPTAWKSDHLGSRRHGGSTPFHQHGHVLYKAYEHALRRATALFRTAYRGLSISYAEEQISQSAACF